MISNQSQEPVTSQSTPRLSGTGTGGPKVDQDGIKPWKAIKTSPWN